MDKEIIYRKVFIKSEKDLPKVKGRYLCKMKYGGHVEIVRYAEDNCFWLQQIESYLQPIELLTKGEIENETLKRIPVFKMPETEDDVNADVRKYLIEFGDWLLNKITGK